MDSQSEGTVVASEHFDDKLLKNVSDEFSNSILVHWCTTHCLRVNSMQAQLVHKYVKKRAQIS